MITDHLSFELAGRKTFERVVGCPPLRVPVVMPDEACFYYIVEGDSRTYTPRGTIRQQTSEGLVLRCGNYFTEFLSTSSNRFEAIAIHLYGDTLRLIYDRDFPDFLEEVDRVQPIYFEHRAASELITAYIKGLEFYFENPSLVSDELQKLKIKELLLLLARTDKASDVRRLIAGLFTATTNDFAAIIEANLFERLDSKELATLCKMSLSGFKRTFRKTFGDAPASYIRQRRLERAAKLLCRTQGRISEVAYDCGFNDLAHFSRTFQKVYGTSPTEWRKRG
ncbi:helix-turn-helix domain-containing protein [Neolewinella persica]|uniref:helix-turn-helix domain-containing protein n=1 Tax=Neolewinella persica TaxID=70998 RepID=UPI0003712060|nr:AraC family transcriptional regulator [Neolewinella persica]